MQSLRLAKLRAASAASTTRFKKCPRGFLFRQSQNGIQRRSIGSMGSNPEAKTSDMTVMTGLAMATGGLYLALSHDLRPLSNRDHQANLRPHPTQPGKLVGENDENMRNHRIQNRDDPSAPGAGRPDQDVGTRGHLPNDSPKAMNPGAISPDVADTPDPRGKPRSFNYMSGKQEGLSNGNTHHSSQISKQPEMSKKGEGVAETAKLKGTVSTNRPGPENKDERGKAQMEKK
ncbi:hypothetical protein DDE82_001611 [Stemphylium lycopersici]|uniref:Uncharacterized protein n=1 Tax=Stemphylium lycopersici TaxID=183478 RepID=A0A364NAB8_STELY|nr:hypothetical protein TW65_00023 [Stemphylium lycopersici]RAR09496.1 hypothetical protein DDE82_001611 [Stemphylium lycopersici]RAR14294.1 hypothetical protein DDE83_002406 [Stemphylium lycopersici]